MAWYQDIGVDPFPLPDPSHKPVYLWTDGIYHNDEEDGITETCETNKAYNQHGAYDLSGRKMVNGKLPKGIYIYNGKKLVK